MFTQLTREFARLEKQVLARVREKVKKAGPVELLLFDINAEGKLFISGTEILIMDAADYSGNGALAELGFGRSFDLYDPKALKLIRDHVHEYFGAKGVLRTLRTALANELQEGYRLGEGMAKISERVHWVFMAYTEGKADKARMIARSEIIRAANGSTQLAWEQSGVVKGKAWLAAADACDYCLEIAADSAVGLGSKFNGRDFGMLEYPPAHPNCRCTMLAELV